MSYPNLVSFEICTSQVVIVVARLWTFDPDKWALLWSQSRAKKNPLKSLFELWTGLAFKWWDRCNPVVGKSCIAHCNHLDCSLLHLHCSLLHLGCSLWHLLCSLQPPGLHLCSGLLGILLLGLAWSKDAPWRMWAIGPWIEVDCFATGTILAWLDLWGNIIPRENIFWHTRLPIRESIWSKGCTLKNVNKGPLLNCWI